MKTRFVAIVALVAIAFAAIAVAVPMADDADGAAAYKPVSYGKDNTNGVRAILYDDAVLMIDLNDATTVSVYSLYQVKLYTATGTASNAITVENISAVNGRLYLDVSGTDGNSNKFIKAGETITAVVKDNTATATIGTVSVVCTTVSDNVPAVMTLSIKSGATYNATTKTLFESANIEGAKTVVTGSDITATLPVRNASLNLTTSLSSDPALVDSGAVYTLVGWDKKGDTTNTVILDAVSTTIEDVIYALGDKGVTFNSTSDANEIYLVAVYEIATYTIKVQDMDDNSDAKKWTGYSTTAASIKLSNGSVFTPATKVAVASVSSVVQADGFALLRIVQDTTLSSYKYTVMIITADATGEAEATTTAVADAYCKVLYLGNGLIKIYDVKQDLKLQVVAQAAAVPGNSGYSLQIDKLTNTDTTYSKNGMANLSLDMTDYVVSSDDTLYMNGTYYKTSSDVRIYGNISNLTLTDDTHYKTYVNGALVSGKLTNHVFDINDPIVTGEYGKSFDLALYLPENYFLYAVQGVWDKSTDATTPWAIASDQAAS